MKTFWNKYKLPILLIAGVIIIALILGGGKYAYDLHETEVNRLEQEKEVLEQKKDSLSVLIKESENKIPEIRETQKTYYYEYQQAQKRANAAESRLKDILYRTYSISYLDSIAKHIKYRDNL